MQNVSTVPPVNTLSLQESQSYKIPSLRSDNLEGSFRTEAKFPEYSFPIERNFSLGKIAKCRGEEGSC